MSLVINITTSSGIVIAADSRQSYKNKVGASRIGSDNASKLFQLNERAGVAITGLAFLPEDGIFKNVSHFISEFKRKEEVERMTIEDLAEKLHRFFEDKYDVNSVLENVKKDIKKEFAIKGFVLVGDFEVDERLVKFKFADASGERKNGTVFMDGIDLMIAGFNHDGSYQVFSCAVPGKIIKKRDSEKQKKDQYGAFWSGQTDVASRIIKGWDVRIMNTPFINKLLKSGVSQETVEKDLGGLEYLIGWGTMTLQDAIDFCILTIKTTEAIQRFSDGTKMTPGSMPGVGGKIDVAIITQDKGFHWVKKKNLIVGDNEVDLDKIENLK